MFDKDDIFGQNDMDDTANTLPTVGFFDFVEKRKTVKDHAKTILGTLIDVYFKGKLITKPTYLALKREMDEKTLETLMYSLETNLHICTKVCEQIDAGDMTPRLLEVYSKIVTAILDIVKVKTNYITIIEDNYKKMADELQVLEDEKSTEIDVVADEQNYDDGMKSIGSKDMIRHIRDTTDLDVNGRELDDKYDARKRAVKDELDEQKEMEQLGDSLDDNMLWGDTDED